MAKFAPGFRFSLLDTVVLVAGFTGVAVLGSMEWWLALVVGIPLATFFLFCNVFRISRLPELLWAGVFVSLAGGTILCDVPGWWATAIGSTLSAALVVALEMCKPSYHGVGWRRINPGLPLWWEMRTEKASDAEPAG